LCNVGPKTAERLYAVGVKTPAQLKKTNPERLYEKLRIEEGGVLDKCVLYQLRGAILDIPWAQCKDINTKEGRVTDGKGRVEKQNY